MNQNMKEADTAPFILSPEETAAVYGGNGELGSYANVHGPAEDKPDMSHS